MEPASVSFSIRFELKPSESAMTQIITMLCIGLMMEAVLVCDAVVRNKRAR